MSIHLVAQRLMGLYSPLRSKETISSGTSLLPTNFTMFRVASYRLMNAVRSASLKVEGQHLTAIRSKHGKRETDEEFDARYEAYFNRPEIDHWEIRKAMNDLQGMDLVPEPKIIAAALKACRRLNDYALAVRFLEATKDKCGSRVQEIYPYLIQELRPTLDELGISTPEEMGYDKPELHLPSVYDMHG